MSCLKWIWLTPANALRIHFMKKSQKASTLVGATESRAFAVRERLMLAAAEIFALEGYANTTVEDVSRHAGVSKRTFYEHFASREDVLTGYVTYGAERIDEYLDNTLQTQTDPLLRVESLIRSYCQLLAAAPMVGYQVMAAGPEPRKVRMAALDRLSSRLQKELLSAFNAGQIRRPPEDVSVELILGGIDAWLLRCHALGQQKKIHSNIETVVDFVKRSFSS